MFAKTYRTTSIEALCILAGTTPVIIKAEETAKRYDVWKGHRANTQKTERVVELNQWPHPADFVNITETNGCEDQTFRNYTDGRKGKRGVGAWVVIFVSDELTVRHKFKLNNTCSNNQAEQLAIVKAPDLTNSLEIAGKNPQDRSIHRQQNNHWLFKECEQP